jgi:hypothetical protein
MCPTLRRTFKIKTRKETVLSCSAQKVSQARNQKESRQLCSNVLAFFQTAQYYNPEVCTLKTQLRFYKGEAVPTLLYGSESWKIKSTYIHRIQSVEMRYLKTVKGCTRLYHIKNKGTGKELEYNQNEINR